MTTPSKTLETFANPKPERDYVIRFETDEFTCLCPKTGSPTSPPSGSSTWPTACASSSSP